MRSTIIMLCLSMTHLTLNAQYKKLSPHPQSGVIFNTSDKALQNLYDIAESKCLNNIKDFNQYKVLVEGAGYPFVWLETQPMGGEMYAKRNIEVAQNNQLIFMDYQRADGRLPGMISYDRGLTTIHAHYGWLQGFCFPEPALNLYYWLNKDTSYLKRLYNCLERFDQYLWKTRDADGNGCLESWCVYDTGEDNSIRLDGATLEWNQEIAPNKTRIANSKEEIQNPAYTGTLPVPMESMDVMSYSYTARAVLAKIAKILNNGQENIWLSKSDQVRAKIKSYLWDSSKFACYDRDSENKQMNILLSNNIRCMYYGSFDQRMADAFIAKHLLNPEEFWTAMPLPTIAANDPAFKNIANNNWSGQPQGLTFQRAIRALENYGHYAEVTLLGTRLIETLKQNSKFTQQYDPFTRKANNSPDGYGPTILCLLEYISRMHGIHYEADHMIWSGLNSGANSSTYAQMVKGNKYLLQINKQYVSAFINDKAIFQCSSNIRCTTDMNGRILSITGIDTLERKVKLTIPGKKTYHLNIKPNCVYKFNKKKQLKLQQQVPFTYKPQA